jgi:hypothetical protein
MNNLRAEAGQHVVWAQARDASCAAGGGSSSSDPLAAGCRKLEHFGGGHTAFLPTAPAAAQRLAPGPGATNGGSGGGLGWPSGMVVWVQNGRPVQTDGSDDGSPNVPGARVRRQTRDVCDLLDAAQALAAVEGSSAAGAAGAQHPLLAHTQQLGSQLPAGRASCSFMFMEDDFRLCPRGVEALAYLLAKAQAVHPDWNEIRVSFGLNGGIIPVSDVPFLAAYFREHLARRPPDHLFVEWFAGETPESAAQKRGRPHLAFRYNLLEHFGFKSSLRSQLSPVYAFCYDLLNDGVVFAVEAFKPNECPMDDVWPCKPPGQAPAIPHRIPFAELAANARTDTVQRWAGQQ